MLETGKNCAVTPNFQLVEDIIENVESTMPELDIETTEEVRK